MSIGFVICWVIVSVPFWDPQGASGLPNRRMYVVPFPTVAQIVLGHCPEAMDDRARIGRRLDRSMPAISSWPS